MLCVYGSCSIACLSSSAIGDGRGGSKEVLNPDGQEAGRQALRRRRGRETGASLGTIITSQSACKGIAPPCVPPPSP